MDYRKFENITFWPIFHSRMEFAQAVRRGLLADPPDVVAVEFPGTWREPIMQGVNRLPFLSLVLGEGGEGHLFLPIEPADAGIEAIRTARELDIPVEMMDLDVNRYSIHRDPLPDSYALYRLGYDEVMSVYYGAPGGAVPGASEGASYTAPVAQPDPLDGQREMMMAHVLQQLMGRHGRVACVVGAVHLPGLLRLLPVPQPRPLGPARPRGLRLYNWSHGSSREFMTEPPFIAAAYERSRRPQGGKGAAGCKDGKRKDPPRPPLPVDREAESEVLVLAAASAYRERYKEQLPPNRLDTLAIFSKKYALVDGLLVPDLYHLVVAARGVADDDFAYELWELGTAYPWQDGSGMLPTIDLDDTFANLDGRKLTLHRKIRRHRPRLARFSDKKRLREKHSGEWRSKWSGLFICSHQPEDFVVEEYGRYLKHKAKGKLSAERTRVEPFQVSLKDGLDVRETLRNWHSRQLFVKEVMPLPGEVGSVVVIFDEDTPGPEGDEAPGLVTESYPWLVTWLGEHAQESDMALYATPAGEEIIGPGISRCEYGGFLLSYPPQRMYDIWRDPYFDAARTKPERLLLAGLDYSVERLVLYVAGRPPRQWLHSLAARMGKKLVYLPIGQLSPNTVRKIRTFHVLDGHHVRPYAKDYIGK